MPCHFFLSMYDDNSNTQHASNPTTLAVFSKHRRVVVRIVFDCPRAGDIGGPEARKLQRDVREAHAQLRGPDGGEPEAAGGTYDGGGGVQGPQGRHREADDREPADGDKVRLGNTAVDHRAPPAYRQYVVLWSFAVRHENRFECCHVLYTH